MQLHPYSILSSSELRGRLILTPCPGTQRTSVAEALDVLKETGVSALLTLMPTEELIHHSVEDLPEHCQLHNIHWFHLPIEDSHVPGEQFEEAWKLVDQKIQHLLAQGETLAIHCKGGSGRTGLFATQLLIECGVDFQDAIDMVRALRPRVFEKAQNIEYLAKFDPSVMSG